MAKQYIKNHIFLKDSVSLCGLGWPGIWINGVYHYAWQEYFLIKNFVCIFMYECGLHVCHRTYVEGWRTILCVDPLPSKRQGLIVLCNPGWLAWVLPGVLLCLPLIFDYRLACYHIWLLCGFLNSGPHAFMVNTFLTYWGISQPH